MTKQPDVYTALGQQCGRCGDGHRTVRQDGRSLADYRQRGFSHRIIVAVAVAAAWPPTESRYLNDAELEALYADAGTRFP